MSELPFQILTLIFSFKTQLPHVMGFKTHGTTNTKYTCEIVSNFNKSLKKNPIPINLSFTITALNCFYIFLFKGILIKQTFLVIYYAYFKWINTVKGQDF